MIFRLSQKLCTKIKAGPLPTLPLDKNLFADWSAHLFVADRTQYILLSNTKSLYSTVLFGRGITDESQFLDHAFSGLRDFMQHDGQEFVYRRFIVPSSGTAYFAKALDRSITGSINELVLHATAMLVEDGLSPFEVGTKLNDLLLSAISPSKPERYGVPREAFKALASSIEP